MDNPFNPSFGRVPKIYINRGQTIHQLENDLQDIDSPYLTTLIYGMRGSGKTTFLSDVSHDMNQYHDWIVVDLPTSKNLIPTLIESVYHQVNNDLKKMLANIGGISIGAAGLQISYQRQLTTPSSSLAQPLLINMA